MPPKKGAPSAPAPKPKMQDMKVVFVGSSGVGKTSLMSRFSHNTFTEGTAPTIGTSYITKEVEVDGTWIRFCLWDTAGQEIYHALVPYYFRQAAVVILVYELPSRTSLEAAKGWMEQIRSNAPKDVEVVLTGNKCDLTAEGHIDLREAEAFASNIGATHALVSAKTGEGVADLFTEIGRNFLRRHPPTEEGASCCIRGGPSSADGAVSLRDPQSSPPPSTRSWCGCSSSSS
eukprot:RCo038260